MLISVKNKNSLFILCALSAFARPRPLGRRKTLKISFDEFGIDFAFDEEIV